MTEELELLVDAKATLGEGPCWDPNKKLLYWVDIVQKKVNCYNPTSNETSFIQLDQMIGTIVPRQKGGAVVALKNGLHFLDLESGALTPISDPENHLPNNRFNDGKCDPKGRFWAGTMAINEDSKSGSLYCLDNDLTVDGKLSGLGISNGLAWSPNHQYMYFIDTPTEKVVRFDYDLETGKIENEVTVVDFKDEVGFPDGMTIDDEGMLWIAHWGGARITRWNPNTGEKLSTLDVPALNVTSCTFGGDNLDELYITTARNGMTPEQLKDFPLSGGLFRVKTDVKGGPTYSFLG